MKKGFLIGFIAFLAGIIIGSFLECNYDALAASCHRGGKEPEV